jgi:hypothetical protein
VFIISKIKEWVLYVSVLLSVVGGIYLRGFLKGKQTEKQKQQEYDNKALETRREINNEISKSSDSELDSRASKWMRKPNE